jgi:glycosyltransferase involved in cell wall biosynthesis
MYQWADRVNWDMVDKVILVSRAKQREFNNRFPAHSDRTAVISPSTSLTRYVPYPRNFNGDIGILCHLAPRKRVYDLILAFYELTKKRHDLRLHIAGGWSAANEDYYVALHHLVGELGLQDRVIFYGHVAETWEWYHKIDIFISHSYSEGLQVAHMEAMASGCYCLAHRWDGAEELLPDENLYFTDTELLEKILVFCDAPESDKQRHREHMRTLAADKFDINRTKVQIRQIVEEVAGSVHSWRGH